MRKQRDREDMVTFDSKIAAKKAKGKPPTYVKRRYHHELECKIELNPVHIGGCSQTSDRSDAKSRCESREILPENQVNPTKEV
jgi:hypothetical protein